jgi:hypothetical protein
MTSTSEILRRFNFFLLNNILDFEENTIEAKGFIDPNNNIFNQPLKKITTYENYCKKRKFRHCSN